MKRLISIVLLLVGCAKDTSGQHAKSEYGEKHSKDAPSTESKLEITPSYPQWNVDEFGFVLHGYDPVSYHQGAPQKGLVEFSLVWGQVGWKFISQKNLDRFKSAPETYAPAVGGYCTFGIIIDKKFDGDPNVWLVENKKTHVFLNEDVKVKFLQAPENWAAVAHKWPDLQKRIPSEL